MCWAPANLRYGRKKTNNDVVKSSLDPMGDSTGEITQLEIWFRDLGNLFWTSDDVTEICFDDFLSYPCRPGSTGLHRKEDSHYGPYNPYTYCDVFANNC